MKFKAKVDWWLHIIFFGFVAMNVWVIVNVFNGGLGNLIVVIIITPFSAFLIVPLWLNTYYFLDENELVVKCGIIRFAKIEYGSIISVSKTRNPISSPAPSLDRLEVQYRTKSGKYNNSVIISPKDKQGFIEQLKLRNNSIETSDAIKPMPKAYKSFLWIISVVTVVGVGGMFLLGEREAEVIIHDTNIQIRGMYGLRLRISDISDISLLDQSMREIGPGMRTNGYGGANAWKGHFTAGLLFVRPDSSPTIRIERNRGSDIFISFRDSARTEMLYYELAALDTALSAS